MNVLIVDDSMMTRMAAKNSLANLGITSVLEASDGAEALEVVKTQAIDIVFSDWNMPVMSGLELLIEVRKINQEIPFVMITTEGSKRKVMQAIELGASDYLAKPFTPATLEEKLKKWVDAV